MQSLEILSANPRGFCGGVVRAIKIVEKALDKFGAPIYVLHEIVHNTHVLNALRKKGALFVNQIEDVPSGFTLIFSAHGVSMAVEEKAQERRLRIIDATCPLVKKVHQRAQSAEREGRQILIIGDKSHPEIIGTTGRLHQSPVVVITEAEACQIEIANPKNITIITQTTLDSDYVRSIINLLRQRFPEIPTMDDDICNATRTRQLAVKNFTNEIDILLVVGSKNSSNSNKLRDIGLKSGVRSYLIDGPDDVDLKWLNGVKKVGITAGASAPEYLVQDVIKLLQTQCSSVTVNQIN